MARSTDAANLFTRSGIAYNYAIGGLPFLSAASIDRPIVRETAPVRKEQFDDQPLPGEQSLEYWWIRSQHSFHGGAGQTFADPTQDNPFNSIRFRESRNVSPWVQGEVSLLHEAKPPLTPVPGVVDATEFNYGDGDPAAFAITATQIMVVRATTVDVATFTESLEDLQSVTTDGSFIIVAALDGVWIAPIPAVYNSAIGTEFVFSQRFSFPNNTSPVFLAWVKSRTMITVGNAVYEVGGIVSGDGLFLSGFDADFASTPDVASLDITGDIDLRGLITPNDVLVAGPTGIGAIAAKYSLTGNQRSYMLSMADGGFVRLNWSTDGTSFVGINSSTSVSFGSGETFAIRATLDVSVRDLTFFTGPSLAGPWTQLGTVSSGAATSIFAGTALLTAGARSDGGSNGFDGIIHAIEVRNGIGGAIVANPDFAAQEIGTEQFTDSTGKLWTLNGNAEISAAEQLPTAKFRHSDDDFKFTGITETSSAILAVGNSGDVRGSILKFVLDADGEVPTLSAATVAAQLPSGEVPYSALGYLGRFVGIGTNKGVRVGVADTAGDIDYGPLLFEVDDPVRAWSARDRFLWCTVSRGNEGHSGLYRIDLSTELAELRFPFATDLVADSDISDCNAIAHVGSSDRLFFATADDVYVESDDLAPTGYLQTSRIRFNTVEPKLFKLLRLRGSVLEAPLAVVFIDQSDSDAGSHLFPTGREPGEQEIGLFSPTKPIDFMSLRFEFNRDTVDLSVGPLISAYQVKALPGSPRQRLIQLPLLCFDWETDRHGQRRGGNGHAASRLLALEAVERTGNTVVLQDFDIGENVECVIEQLNFEQTAPPPKVEGWGGILTATLRTL